MDSKIPNQSGDDAWRVGDAGLGSRFLLGTAGYPSPQVLGDAIAASGTQIVTVGLKRQLAAGGDNGFIDIIRAAMRRQGARLLRERLPGMVLIVYAGIGTPSHAAQALELGFDAVLLNSAVSQSSYPVRMAGAFRQAIEAGRAAYLAGVMARQDFAVATTPVTGNPLLID